MAEFGRAATGVHGFPQANMFHQPDLEQLLLGRVAAHPLITLHRTAEVIGLDNPAGTAVSPSSPDSPPVTVTARTGPGGQERAFAGCLVLGCDGAGSTIRDLAGLVMEDLGFTERWLVIDIRVAAGLEAWDGVEQICDPARAATFMQVTGDRYRWEFQLRDGEDEDDLITEHALGALLRPWTQRDDLAGMEITRSATYTFRARLASAFRSGRVFLLGDAAHLTPPFIGQGLAAGLRDADNLSWKITHVLTGRAGAGLLDSYQTERRPHARAMVKKAVMIGWAMTGGQDRAAAVRRVALAAAVRVAPVREAIASTATPRLKAGALQHGTGRAARRGVRAGSLIPNPLVRVKGPGLVRLDAVLAGQTAVLTSREPDQALAGFCDRYGLVAAAHTSRSRASGRLRTGPRGSRRCCPRFALDRGLPGRGRPGRPTERAHRQSRPLHPRPAGPRDRCRRRGPQAAGGAVADPPAGQPAASRRLGSVPSRSGQADRSLNPGVRHVPCHFPAPSPGLHGSGGREAGRRPGHPGVGGAPRDPVEPVPADQRARAGRRHRGASGPAGARARRGRRLRDGDPADRRPDRPPQGQGQHRHDGTGTGRLRRHRWLPGRSPDPLRRSQPCSHRQRPMRMYRS